MLSNESAKVADKSSPIQVLNKIKWGIKER